MKYRDETDLPSSVFILTTQKKALGHHVQTCAMPAVPPENAALNTRAVAVSFAPAAVPDAGLPCEAHWVSV